MKAHFLILSIVLAISTACRKEKEATLSGRIVNCNGDPATDITIKVHKIKRLGQTGGAIAQATTDENGNFSITYKSDLVKMNLYINGKYMTNVPSQKNIDFGDLYFKPVVKAVIKVKVLNPPASNIADTLYCFPYGGYYMFKCPPPVHDTVFPIEYYNGSEVIEYKYRDKIKKEFGWQFGDEPVSRKYFYLSPCTQVPDTITITVE